MASSCSLRVGIFSSLGAANGASGTQLALATGRLAGGRRTLINYLLVYGSGGLLRAVPVTSSVTCLLAAIVPGSPPVRLPLRADFDAEVVASSVPGIVLVPNAPLPRIHVTIRQDLGAAPPVESVAITDRAGTATYYVFDPGNSWISPRTFVIRALP